MVLSGFEPGAEEGTDQSTGHMLICEITCMLCVYTIIGITTKAHQDLVR